MSFMLYLQSSWSLSWCIEQRQYVSQEKWLLDLFWPLRRVRNLHLSPNVYLDESKEPDLCFFFSLDWTHLHLQHNCNSKTYEKFSNECPFIPSRQLLLSFGICMVWKSASGLNQFSEHPAQVYFISDIILQMQADIKRAIFSSTQQRKFSFSKPFLFKKLPNWHHYVHWLMWSVQHCATIKTILGLLSSTQFSHKNIFFFVKGT